LGDKKLAMISTRDIGRAAAKLFTSSSYLGKIIGVSCA